MAKAGGKMKGSGPIPKKTSPKGGQGPIGRKGSSKRAIGSVN